MLTDPLPEATPFTLDKIVLGRRSVRSFDSRPVAKESLEEIIDLARWSPSPHNAQPWRLAVLTSPDAKRDLALAMGERWQRDLLSDGTSSVAVDIRTTQSYERITSAPVAIIACLSMEDMDRYPDGFRQSVERSLATQAIGAFTQTLLLAAHSRGLCTVWMCAPAFCPDVVQTALQLPRDWEPQVMVLLGYSADNPSPPPRMDPTEFVVYRPNSRPEPGS